MATEKRLIDANECYERAWDHTAFYHHVADMSILRDLLNDCPTVDAVEVVRCNNCKHSQMNGGDCSGILTIHHKDDVLELNIAHYVRLGFCSYGERK